MVRLAHCGDNGALQKYIRDLPMTGNVNVQRSLQWLCAAVFALGLSACGGGSSPSAPSLNTSGEEPQPQPSATSGQARYRATTASERDYNTRKDITKLVIIDTQTNQIVRTTTLNGAGRQVTELMHGYKVDVAAGDFSIDGQRAVYYIQGGKVYRQDLNTSELPSPKQISSLQNACGIQGSTVTSPSNEVLEIITLRPDGSCVNADDDTVAQIETSMSSTDQALPLSKQTIDGIFKSDGDLAPLAMMVHDKTTNKLWAYSTNLQTKLYEIATPAGKLATDSDMEVNVDPKRGYQLLRIDDSLYNASFAGGKLVMGGAVASSTGQTAVKELLGYLDKTFVLYQDNRLEQFVSPTQPTRYIASLPADVDDVAEWKRHANELIAMVETLAPRGTDYYKINVATGVAQKLGTKPYSASDSVVTMDGDDLFVLRRGTTYDSPMKFVRYVIATGQAQEVLNGIIPAGFLGALRDYEYQLDGIVYCYPVGARRDCAGAPLHARNLKTSDDVIIGTYSADPTWISSTPNIDDPFVTGSLMELQTWNYTSNTAGYTDVWTFNPKQANSLTRLTFPQ